MYKFIILFLPLFFIGCANYSVNAAMCEKLIKDPHDPVPQECRDYVEAEAEKASKTKKKILSPGEAIEFTKQ